jgi:hypothetical protein
MVSGVVEDRGVQGAGTASGNDNDYSWDWAWHIIPWYWDHKQERPGSSSLPPCFKTMALERDSLQLCMSAGL